jgi:riboflavin kinase/FMN adenylyltransferase
MDIFHSLDDVTHHPDHVLTVGTFDGVHLGHRFIFSELMKIADSIDGIPTAVTFDPHPQVVLQKKEKREIKILSTIKEKTKLLSTLGIRKFIIIPFTKSFSQLTAEDYVRHILYKMIGFKGLVVGFDHAFGKNREGGMHTLRRIASELNFEVFQVAEFKKENLKISSTRIRAFLGEGNIRFANTLLGYPYTIIGKVVRGDGRGKEIGFPTANIGIANPHKLFPANGVYVVSIEIDGNTYRGMSNIGNRPTFQGENTVFEIHIFDFHRNIYDKEVSICFHERIRDEKKFDNVKGLQEQLIQDKMYSLEYFKRNQQEI